MPDITMCKGLECPMKRKCYRFLAKPDMLQSFFVDIPYEPKTNSCEYLMPLYKDEKYAEVYILDENTA